MLAPIAALHLVLLAQIAPPPPPPPQEPGKLVDDEYDAPAGNPPLPDRPGRGGDAPAPEPSGRDVPPPPAAYDPAADRWPDDARAPAVGTLPPPRAQPVERRLVSLLSAEPLRGASAALVWAGWSSVGAMVAQGFGREDDLGLLADLDWATTELRLGAFYRRPLGPAGPFAMAGRLSLAWYKNFGAEWVHDENRRDRGFEITPGLSLSARGAGGIFSALADGPITVTVRGDAGLLFSPRVGFAYEAPLFEPYTVGVRAGIGYRAGAGDAPLRDGRAELTFLVLGGARL